MTHLFTPAVSARKCAGIVRLKFFAQYPVTSVTLLSVLPLRYLRTGLVILLLRYLRTGLVVLPLRYLRTGLVVLPATAARLHIQ